MQQVMMLKPRREEQILTHGVIKDMDLDELIPAPTRIGRLCQRIAKWLLRGSKRAIAPTYKSVYRPVDWNYDESGQSILNAIRMSTRDLMAVFREEAKTLIIGYEHAELLNLEQEAREVCFGFDIRPKIGFGNEVKVCGMQVEYIPWMRGWALLPELGGKQ